MDEPNSNSSQQQKQQRRKRKDPESRDFACKCGKSYLSYAAAYTHVKNKHNGDSEYLNNISRPGREKLKRGRPKEKKAFSITEETEKLSVIEEAILSIYEAVEKNEDLNGKIILEGNQQLRQEELNKSYEELTMRLGIPALSLHLPQSTNINKNLYEFIQSINKHFVSQIAVKIIWLVNYCLGGMKKDVINNENGIENGEEIEVEVDGEMVRERAKDPNCLSLWGERDSISEIVIVALERWMSAVYKNSEHSEKYD